MHLQTPGAELVLAAQLGFEDGVEPDLVGREEVRQGRGPGARAAAGMRVVEVDHLFGAVISHVGEHGHQRVIGEAHRVDQGNLVPGSV